MKAVFFHDHIFKKETSGRYYSQGSFPYPIWSRYLDHFETLTVIGRKQPITSEKINFNKLAISSGNRVDFILLDNISSAKSFFYSRRRVKNEINRIVSKHDAVIVRLSSELGLLAIEEAKRQNKPWAVELVDCPWDALMNYGSLKAKLYAPLLAWRVKRALASSSYALYVTQDFLQRRYPAPKAITVDCSNVQIPSLNTDILNKRITRIETSNSREKIVFGLLGSLHGKFKGIQTAMEALASIKDKLPPFEFRILGSGDPSPWQTLANQYGLSDNVFFDGTLPSGEPVFEWLDNIDIYLHPSLKEGLPRALIEAMSRGCPAIASSVAGTPELLGNEYLIHPGEADILAEKILKLSSSINDQTISAKENFETASRYSQEHLDKKRFAFWKSFSDYCRSSQV